MKKIFYISILALSLLKGQFSYPAEDFLGGGIGYSPMYIKLDSVPGATYLKNIGLDPSDFDDPFVVHGGEGFAHVTGRWRIGGYAGMGGTSVSTIPEISIFIDGNGNDSLDAGDFLGNLLGLVCATGLAVGAVIIRSSNNRIITYYDSYLKKSRYEGVSWYEQCQKIISNLPEQVYISFDLDGLDPKLCPHTGTPVAGGLNLEAVFYLLKQVIDSNRKIIGFDVSEVGNGEWDGNVGARIIYKLCCLLGL